LACGDELGRAGGEFRPLGTGPRPQRGLSGVLATGQSAMAQIIGALGVPHTPFFPALVEREGPQCETAQHFAAVTAELEAMRPDLIVMFDTDHLNTFFYDALPVFAIGAADTFKGPNDEPRSVPVYTIKSRADVANHIRNVAVAAGYDLAV